MKLRLLNGAHSTLAAIGRLAGYATVAEAMADPVIRVFVRAYWDEVTPTIAVHIDVSAYTARLLMRFDNVALRHKLDQIATDASQKVSPRILGPLRDLRAQSAPHGALVLAVAAWMRSCEGVDDAGAGLPMNDPVLANWTSRPTAAMSASVAVRRWLDHAPVFGTDLAQDDRLAADLSRKLEEIRKRGVLAVVSDWLGGR
jgi:fructuronate reductase